MRHFLQYWRTYDPEKEFDTPLNYAASSQFRTLRKDDILWVVALKQHRLTLLGRLIVGKIVSRKQAIKEFGENIYDAPLCAIAKPGTEHNIIEADIQALAPQLRFNSSHDRLSLPDPERTNGKQLQRLRELTPDTATALQSALDSDSAQVQKPEESDEAVTIAQEQAAGFQSNPAIRRAVEKFAMAKAHSALVGKGYKNLKDTAKFKPYDYTCQRDGKNFFVEVKGTQTPGKTLILTRGEVEHIKNHAEECILVLVHSVSVSGKRDVRVSGGTAVVKESWRVRAEDLSPIQYAWTVS